MVLDMNAMLFCSQHTILGKMAYAPTVGRLACGHFPSDPHGFWQDDGYGVLSVFKKDWNRFGGVYLSYCFQDIAPTLGFVTDSKLVIM